MEQPPSALEPVRESENAAEAAGDGATAEVDAKAESMAKGAETEVKQESAAPLVSRLRFGRASEAETGAAEAKGEADCLTGMAQGMGPTFPNAKGVKLVRLSKADGRAMIAGGSD